MSSIVASLREELATLQDEVRRDPRNLKIEQIKSLLSLYEHNGGGSPQVEHNSSCTIPRNTNIENQEVRSYPGRSEGSKAYRVKYFVREILKKDGPTHREQILKSLVKEGLMGLERNPMGGLAAYLSSWRDEFESDGKGKFHLRNKGVSAPHENGSGDPSPDPSEVSLLKRETSERG